jgi:hypothetical protein
VNAADTQGQNRYEPCEECGAPMDPQQRYCVNCAARRGNGANPTSRYFAAMGRRARRPPPRSPQKGPGSRAAAVGFFALLPIAVAIGVVVGRADSGGGGDEQALLQALREQKTTTASAAPTTASAKTAKNAKGRVKEPAKGQGKVVAKTSNGEVHEVAGFVPSKEKEEADTALVEENPEQVGSNYIKAQQNLPDVIVVGGEGTGSPAPSGKGGEP